MATGKDFLTLERKNAVISLKKFIFFLIIVLISIAVGYNLAKPGFSLSNLSNKAELVTAQKREILRFALVADSENDNEMLSKALAQAQGQGINFVAGLGDWSTVGTVDELTRTKAVFEKSKLEYFLTSGDHDLWDSRSQKKDALFNFTQVFGKPNHLIERNGIQIDLLDNSDIYKGILNEGWQNLDEGLKRPAKLHFVMAHKTPFHPQSAHVMGEDSVDVAAQAKKLLTTLTENAVDGFFSGDMHFFAQFNSPDGKLPITTIGAIAREKNFQGPRFAVVTVYDDYSWEVEDVEIR